MNGNAELLNFIYQNSQMGVTTTDQLIKIADDEEFKKHLKAQWKEYDTIFSETKAFMDKNGYDEKGLNAFEKFRTYLMINMQTVGDNSPSHIAEMLMIGSNMGIIDATKNIKRYKDAQPEFVQLMNRLLQFEEGNLQQLKNFL